MPRAIDLRQLEADYDPNRSGTEFHLGAYTGGFAEMWQKILAKVQADLEASVIAAIEELLGIDLSMFDLGEIPTIDDILDMIPGVGDIIDIITNLITGTGAPATLPATLPFTLGGTNPISTFFGNLSSLLGVPDLTDELMDVNAAAEAFINSILHPTGLLTSGQEFQDLIDTIWQAITHATGVDNLLDDLFASLRNIPFLNVLGVGGPVDIGASIQSTWDQLISGLVGTPGSGTSLADLFNIGQTVSSRSSLGQFSWDILGIRNNKSLNTGFLPTSESNIALDKVALQSSAPTFALTQSTAITAYQRISEAADKSAVSWMGSGVTNITSAFVNIFKMDTTTGQSALVHASTDIVGLLSNTMQHNVYTLPTAIPVKPGDVFGIEVAVRGAGTHSIVGASTWLPDHPSVFPRRMSAVRNSGTSAAPLTIAHSALTYSSNVPFVEFAVSSGDTGIPHSPQIDFFGTVGTTTVPVPSWANTVQVVAVGGGGGGRQGGTVGFSGEGGNAGSWVTATWLRGTDFTGTPSVSITVGAGGTGGSSGLGLGGNGDASTVSIPGHSVIAPGGEGGDAVNLGGGDKEGRSPGNQVYDGITYVGGVQQNTFGGNGSAAGGGAAGGNYVSFQRGGAGARGGVWLRFKT